MVARIRRNFCQYRMRWERLESKGVRRKGIALGTSVSIGCRRECTHLLVFVGLRCGVIMVQGLEGTSVSIGCFGRE